MLNKIMQIKKKMKTKYTKKQIQEAIKHWEKVLERLNEDSSTITMVDLGDIDHLKKLCNFSFDDYDRANEITGNRYRTKPGANPWSFNKEDMIPLKNCEFLLQQYYQHRPKNGKLKDWYEENEFDALPGEFEDPGINWIWYRGYRDAKTAAERYLLITQTKDLAHAMTEVCQLHEGDWGFRIHK